MSTTEGLATHPAVSSKHFLREVIHWIGDEHASTISFLKSVAKRSGDPEVQAVLRWTADLLYEYATVYRALATPARDGLLDASAYLPQVCEALCHRLQRRRIKLILADCPVEVDEDRCRRLGMVIVALISSAACRDFAHPGGTIRVELAEVGRSLVCSVADNARPLVTLPSERSDQIVNQLAAGLGGKVRRRLVPHGNLSLLVIPNP
jgi:two-component sensor histidine kinase